MSIQNRIREKKRERIITEIVIYAVGAPALCAVVLLVCVVVKMFWLILTQ